MLRLVLFHCACGQVGIADSYTRMVDVDGTVETVRYDYHSIDVPQTKVQASTWVVFDPLPSATKLADFGERGGGREVERDREVERERERGRERERERLRERSRERVCVCVRVCVVARMCMLTLPYTHGLVAVLLVCSLSLVHHMLVMCRPRHSI